MQAWLNDSEYLTSSALPQTTFQLVKMVRAKRIDVGLANQAVLEYYLKGEQRLDEFRIQVLKEMPLGVYIRDDWLEEHPLFLESLNTAIAACRT